MKRVLVTGGAGFVGRPALAALVARGFEVYALSRRAPEGAHVVRIADILDRDARRAAVRAAGASHLLHLAWVTEPGHYWQAPENLDWTAASLDLVRSFHEAGGTRAVVAGTCAEYDWTGIDRVTGPSPPSPRTRGEGRAPLVGGETSGSEGEGASTDEASSDKSPHLRLPARFGDDEVAEALSPTDPGLARDQQARTEVGQAQLRAGRGDTSAIRRGHLSESASCRPAMLYGAAKDGLRRVLSAYASTGLSLAWGRLFYLYGPGEAPGRLVGEAARALLTGQRFATSEGRQRRDFLHVTDAGEAFAALLDSGVEGPVNIGSGAAVPVRTILETLGRLTGRPELIEFGARPLPLSEPACIEADIRRLVEEVGYRPRLTLDEGLRATLAAYSAR